MAACIISYIMRHEKCTLDLLKPIELTSLKISQGSIYLIHKKQYFSPLYAHFEEVSEINLLILHDTFIFMRVILTLLILISCTLSSMFISSAVCL